ncbi:mandelate racemase/muconate lactonizing enzyme family protein [Pseudaestuariivita sp.]|uniref:mandelate racemase/muconate lactonizing enzyme family protein n=1 Tax=Pseudaestuariivita sp. TaxID=2211669 RepID=UPI0040588C0E
MSRIVSVEARLFNVPLDEVLVDAKHGTHTHFHLITATVTLENGLTGTGYTYTGGRGGEAVLAMIRHDLAPFLIGQAAEDVEALNEAMSWHMHYVGRGGVLSFAVSAVDIALWDLRCKAAEKSLWAMTGAASKTCRAYAGGIDLNFTLDRLLANVQGYLDAGFNAVKIKIGKPDPAQDLERIAAVRDLLGPDRPFMVDANYALTPEAAIALAKGFADQNIFWFEEPIIPEDLAGYRKIRDAVDVPLAQGENLHTNEDFDAALASDTLTYLQPDASNCLGITGWLRAAKGAKAKGIEICSHGMQELHVSLVAAQAHGGWLEVHSFPIDHYTTRSLTLDGQGRAIAPDEVGIGVTFDWDKLAPFEVVS